MPATSSSLAKVAVQFSAEGIVLRNYTSYQNSNNNMEPSNQNNIDIEKIIQAGKSIKAIVYTILIMIFSAFLIMLVIFNSNAVEVEFLESTYTIIGILGLTLNIYILYSLFRAGSNLENVKLSSKEQHNKNIIKNNISNSPVSKSNILGRVEMTKKEIIIYTDELDKHGLVFSKNNLGSANWDDAKKLCKDYNDGGYSDWRLPNKEELQLFNNWKLNNNSSVIVNIFWSSEENDETSAYYQDIKTGYFHSSNKTYDRYVRAVRSF